MAGAGIEIRHDRRGFQELLSALAKAPMPDAGAAAGFMGEELRAASNQAFAGETGPAAGAERKAVRPRSRRAARPGTADSILQDRGTLKYSLDYAALGNGSVIFGSNLVYAGIHQRGGQAGRGKKVTIPARPYLGVPRGFNRQILNDPALLRLLGVGQR